MIKFKDADVETKQKINEFIKQQIDNGVRSSHQISKLIEELFSVERSPKGVYEHVKETYRIVLFRGPTSYSDKMFKTTNEIMDDISPLPTTRRCKNKLCINRFVPVNSNNFFCSSVCHGSDLQWTTEEILQEEGSLLPEATHIEMAKRAFEQKNSLIRKVTNLTSLREFFRYEMKELHDSDPSLRFPVVPILKESTLKGSKERELVVVLSDWQIGKMENGIGVKIMEDERIPRLMDAVKSIRNQYIDAELAVPRIRVVLLGDMLENCLPAGSMVYTINGPKPIESIEKGDFVWGLGPNGFEQSEVITSAMTGIDPIYTIKTSDRVLKCNGEHPILTRKANIINDTKFPERNRYTFTYEYVRAKDLKENDIVCILNNLPETNLPTPTRELSIEFMEFLGFYLGDGCLGKDRNGEYNTVCLAHHPDADYIDHYLNLARKLFFKNAKQDPIHIGTSNNSYMSRFYSKEAASEIKSLIPGLSSEKRVPYWVFGLKEEFKLAFLRGYLDTDGHVSNTGQLVFGSPNKELMEDIRHLCMSVGIKCTILKHKIRRVILPNTEESKEYPLTVFSCGSSTLNLKIGSNSPSDLSKLQKYADSHPIRKSEYKDSFIPNPPEPPVGTSLSKIKSISISSLAEPVYNITVKNTHSFIADGVITHNCWIYAGQNVTGLDRTANSHRITKQIPLTARLISSVVRDIASYTPEVIVESVPGNHGRPNGKNDFADPEDNFDTMIAYWAADKVANQTNIKWNIHEDWWGKFNTFGHDVVMFHGDQWRGPVWALQNLLPQWITSNTFKSNPKLVLTGHRHDFATFKVNGITVCQNGTIDGGSNWYLKLYGKSSPPCQTILVTSEKRGLEAIYPVYFN